MNTIKMTCLHCQRKDTSQPTPLGYADDIRRQAIQFYVDGKSLRRIERHLGWASNGRQLGRHPLRDVP